MGISFTRDVICNHKRPTGHAEHPVRVEAHAAQARRSAKSGAPKGGGTD
jgi:hypothetical protein